MLDPAISSAFHSLLKEELVLATGCTEPIAIAYCAARMRETLGAVPEEVTVEVSGNILKNAKSVVVPNTGGLKGVAAAAAAGIVAGDADGELQVIASVPEERYGEIAAFLEHTPISVVCPDDRCTLDIRVIGRAGNCSAAVRVADGHTNVVSVEKDGEFLLRRSLSTMKHEQHSSDDFLTLENILAYVREADLTEVTPLLERQLRCNSAIAEEGLRSRWGAGIGALTLEWAPGDICAEARAWAAAGSDARMSGCEMPVVIVSGSGNQGITASMPVYRYALHVGADSEKLYRALALSDLVTVYQKKGIGKLSAYCGAISAGVGAGAGIAFLDAASDEAIAHTIVNAVVILSGAICDGAKPSCAAKISAAVDAGITGYRMYKSGRNFHPGDGIVGVDVDATVSDVGVLAREGMHATDRTILSIMTK